MDEMDERMRKEFLINMYNQMWNNINRHINVVWQPIALLVASLGLLSFAEKEFINFDLAITLVVLLSGWFIAHVYDSSTWYNRNLVILSNIEKQFLRGQDEKEIHFFFKRSHRKIDTMITHFKLQRALGIGLIFIVLYYHVTKRIVEINLFLNKYLQVLLPYLVAVIVVIYLNISIKSGNQSYEELLEKSPGKEMELNPLNNN